MSGGVKLRMSVASAVRRVLTSADNKGNGRYGACKWFTGREGREVVCSTLMRHQPPQVRAAVPSAIPSITRRFESEAGPAASLGSGTRA